MLVALKAQVLRSFRILRVRDYGNQLLLRGSIYAQKTCDVALCRAIFRVSASASYFSGLKNGQEDRCEDGSDPRLELLQAENSEFVGGGC